MKRALGCLVLSGGVNVISGINLQPGTTRDDAQRESESRSDLQRRQVPGGYDRGSDIKSFSLEDLYSSDIMWLEDVFVRKYFRLSDKNISVWRKCAARLIDTWGFVRFMVFIYFLFGTRFGRALLVARAFSFLSKISNSTFLSEIMFLD